MGSFLTRASRRGSKTQGRKPDAAWFYSWFDTVAGAAPAAMARRQPGCYGRTLERGVVARATFLTRAHSRMGGALATGRLLPWFTVAYGAGVVLYFTAEREPALWAAALPTALFALAAVFFRRQIVPQMIALGLFGIALGLAVATLKTSLINHPELRFPASGVTVAGFVELREES